MAFAAYAVAQMGAVQTPAFPEQTADVLRDTFARLVSSRVWSYWDTPGSCGEPWTVFCKYTGKSMCELNTMGSLWCPDPVLFQNIMYSGHLLQVGVLYEAFSADPSLSTVGWSFYGEPNRRRGVPPIAYNLGALAEAVHYQSRRSGTGAYPCEPSMVYLVCNQHTFSAVRLYNSLASHGHVDYLSEAPKWLGYFSKAAVRPLGSAQTSGWLRHPLQDSFFSSLYQESLQLLSTDGGTEAERALMAYLSAKFPMLFDEGWLPATGAVGNDAWASTWMVPWASDTALGASLLRDATESIAPSPEWQRDVSSGGAWLQSSAVYVVAASVTGEYATSFVPAGLGGWNASSRMARERVKDAFKYMEAHFGRAVDTDGNGVDDAYLYETNKDDPSMPSLPPAGTGSPTNTHQSAGGATESPTKNTHQHKEQWATANLALGTAFSAEAASSLYSGDVTRRAFEEPHVAGLTQLGPRASARLAIFRKNVLTVHLVTAARTMARGIVATIGMPPGWTALSTTVDGAFVLADAARAPATWHGLEGTAFTSIKVDLPPDRDLVVRISCEASR